MARGITVFLAAALALGAAAGDDADASVVPTAPPLTPLFAAAAAADDECAAGDGEGPSSCALSALQRRGSPVKADLGDTFDVPISTFDVLKWVVETYPAGRRIEVEQDAVITFSETLNILENSTWEIWSQGATLDGTSDSGQVRLFYVLGNLTLAGLLLRNGGTDYGGAIYADYYSSVNISRCNFLSNEAMYQGGAIAVKGATLALHDVSFRKNAAENFCPRGKRCAKRRRGDWTGNAVYIQGNSTVEATLRRQPKSQDFYFESDFGGAATFRCAAPSLGPMVQENMSAHVQVLSECALEATAMAAAAAAAEAEEP